MNPDFVDTSGMNSVTNIGRARAGPRPQLMPVAAMLLSALVLVVPAQAQAPGLAMLDQLAKGRWELRFRDGSPPESICVRNGREFIQIRHPENECSRYIIDDGPSSVSVQYTCPGHGYGLTAIRRETRSLVQIKASGLSDQQPFEFVAEGRRIAEC